eukprot:TRINITY_DN1982_c0_g1_i3.p1 TRINITY_DN1982_c0_g1~~TRINITY_DN1982_c0_g1_i3.p1  ORF type:complete len:887 (-),score=226.87 TRINITY_DN1982_c0_g1_i3:63-2534(-)
MQDQRGIAARSAGAKAFAHGSNQTHRQRCVAFGLAVAIAAAKPEAERYYEEVDTVLGHSLFRSFVDHVVRALRDPLPRRRPGKAEHSELQPVKAEEQEVESSRRPNNKKLMAEQKEAPPNAEQQKADTLAKVNRQAKDELDQGAEAFHAGTTIAVAGADAQLQRERAEMHAEDSLQQLLAAKDEIQMLRAEVQSTSTKAAETHQKQVALIEAERQQLKADISLQRALAEKETKARQVELADAVRLRAVQEHLRQQADTALAAARRETKTFAKEIKQLKSALEAERGVVSTTHREVVSTKQDLHQLKADMKLQQALAKKETEALKDKLKEREEVHAAEKKQFMNEKQNEIIQLKEVHAAEKKQFMNEKQNEIIQLKVLQDTVDAHVDEKKKHMDEMQKMQKEIEQLTSAKARLVDESLAAQLEVERARMTAEDVTERARAQVKSHQAARAVYERLHQKNKKKAQSLQTENKKLKTDLQKALKKGVRQKDKKNAQSLQKACQSQSSQPSDPSEVSQPSPCHADKPSQPEPSERQPSNVSQVRSQPAPSQPSEPPQPSQPSVPPRPSQPEPSQPSQPPQPSQTEPTGSAQSQMTARCGRCGLQEQLLHRRVDYDTTTKQELPPTYIIDCATCGSYVYTENPAPANPNPGSGVLGKLRVMSLKGTEHERKRAAEKYAAKRGELEGIAQNSTDEMQRKRARVMLQEDQREKHQAQQQEQEETLQLRRQEWDLQRDMLNAIIEKSTALHGSCLQSNAAFISKLSQTRNRWCEARDQFELSFAQSLSREWLGLQWSLQCTLRDELSKLEAELQSLRPAVPTPPPPPWRRP